jgi:hypothetical protein
MERNKALNKDDERFDCSIKIEARHIIVSINGKVTAARTQPED